MKQHEGQSIRRLIVAVTLVAMLAAGGLLLTGSVQRTLAVAPLALGNSEKTASSETVSPGGELTYQIVLNNESDEAVGPLSVRDTLPHTLTYVENSQSVTPAGAATYGFDASSRIVSFSVPSVGSQASVTLSFRATADASLVPGAVITNTAVITWAGGLLELQNLVTVESPPTARIEAPWDNQLITERGVFTVEGRAWTQSQTPEFPEAPVLDEIMSTQPFYNVTWSAVAGADVYILQEADNPYFTDATEFLPTTTLSQLVTEKAVGTYYYRVKASSALYGDGFWSNVVSHTVAAGASVEAEAAVAPAATVSTAPDLEINIKPVGGADAWVSIDSVVASPLGDWWNWSYDWDLPEADGDQYVIQVRGTDLSGNGELSVVDTVTVTVQNELTTIYLPLIMRRYPPVPLAPVLQVLGDPADGSYQLSWTYPHTEFVPTSYELQEATNPEFVNATVLPAPVTSPYARTDMPAGHYYYRVRGINAAGAGDWSNVVHAEVAAVGFFDDFTNPASGWPREVVRIDNRPVFDMDYDAGTYRAKIMLDRTGLNNYHMGIARAPYENPFTHYQVEAEHRFVRASDQLVDPEWGKGGLVFAASSDYRTLFVVEWRWPDGWCAISKYRNVGGVVVDWRWIPGNGAIRAWGPCPSILSGYDRTNEARVVVEGNTASVYINDALIRTFTDNDLTGAHRLGLLTGSYERTPVESRFDSFRVTRR